MSLLIKDKRGNGNPYVVYMYAKAIIYDLNAYITVIMTFLKYVQVLVFV